MIMVHACPLTLKLFPKSCERELELEMETSKFHAKINFNLHRKSSGLQAETSDFGPDFLFSFLNGAQPVGWIL